MKVKCKERDLENGWFVDYMLLPLEKFDGEVTSRLFTDAAKEMYSPRGMENDARSIHAPARRFDSSFEHDHDHIVSVLMGVRSFTWARDAEVGMQPAQVTGRPLKDQSPG